MNHVGIRRVFITVLMSLSVAARIANADMTTEQQAAQLSTFAGLPGSRELQDGDYTSAETIISAAIRLGRRAGWVDNDIAQLYTNLCVAQFMQGRGEEARISCDRAVSLAKRYAPWSLPGKRARQSVIATTMGNRHVVRRLTVQ